MSNSVHTQFHVSEDIHTILAEPLDALDDNLERWNEVIQDIIAFYISIDVSSNWHAHGKDMSQFIRDIYSMMKGLHDRVDIKRKSILTTTLTSRPRKK